MTDNSNASVSILASGKERPSFEKNESLIYRALRPIQLYRDPLTGALKEQGIADDYNEFTDGVSLFFWLTAPWIGLLSGYFGKSDDLADAKLSKIDAKVNRIKSEQEWIIENRKQELEMYKNTPQEITYTFDGKEFKVPYIPALGNIPHFSIGIGSSNGEYNGNAGAHKCVQNNNNYFNFDQD